MGEIVAWRFRYDGGKWTVQKNKPAWYRDHMADVEIEPLYAPSALLQAKQEAYENAATICDDRKLKVHPKLSPGSEMNAWWSGQTVADQENAEALRAKAKELQQ